MNYTIPARLSRIALTLMAGFIILYVLIYLFTPLPAPWSDIYLNLAIDIPALLAAVFATLVWRTFSTDDAPRPVWLYFALGLWSWTIAEFSWTIIWLVQGDVPIPFIPDIFWILAYIFLSLSFMFQYRLVTRTGIRTELFWMAGAALAIVGATLITTGLIVRNASGTEIHWSNTFFDIFYVYGDLGITLAALGLARLFGRGLWGRMWIALIVMTLSDALYSIVELSGLYALSAESGNLLSLVIDTLYALAYLILAMACYGQYLLVRHGPSLSPHPAGDDSSFSADLS